MFLILIFCSYCADKTETIIVILSVINLSSVLICQISQRPFTIHKTHVAKNKNKIETL